MVQAAVVGLRSCAVNKEILKYAEDNNVEAAAKKYFGCSRSAFTCGVAPVSAGELIREIFRLYRQGGFYKWCRRDRVMDSNRARIM